MAASSSSSQSNGTAASRTEIRFPMVVADQSFYSSLSDEHQSIEHLEAAIAHCHDKRVNFSKEGAERNSALVCLQYPIVLSAGTDSAGAPIDADDWSTMVDVGGANPTGMREIAVSTSDERADYTKMPFVFVHPSTGGGRPKNLGLAAEMFEPTNIDRFLDYYPEAGIPQNLNSLSLGGNAKGTSVYDKRNHKSAARIIAGNFMAVIDTDTQAYKSIVNSAVDDVLTEHSATVAQLGVERTRIRDAVLKTFGDVVSTLVFAVAPNPLSRTKQYVFHVEASPIITSAPLMVLPFVCAFAGADAFLRWDESMATSGMVRMILARVAERIGDADVGQQLECISLVKCRRLMATATSPKLAEYFNTSWYPASSAKTKSKSKDKPPTINYRLFLTTFVRLLFLAAGRSGPKKDDFSSASWSSVCYRKIGAKGKYRSSYTYADQLEMARAAIEYKDDPKHIFNKYGSMSMYSLHHFFDESKHLEPRETAVDDDDDDDEPEPVIGALAEVQPDRANQQGDLVESTIYDEGGDVFASGHAKKKQRKRSSKHKKKRQRDGRQKDDGDSERVKRVRQVGSHSDIDSNAIVQLFEQKFSSLLGVLEEMRRESAEHAREAYQRGAEDAYKKIQQNQQKDLERLLSDSAATLAAINDGDGARQQKPAASSSSKKKRSRYADEESDYEEAFSDDLSDDGRELNEFSSESENEVEVYTPRPSTRRSKKISNEEFEKNVAAIDVVARAEASSDEDSDDGFIVEDDDESSGVDLEESDEEDNLVEDLDLTSLGHILQETIDQGRGPQEDEAIILTSKDVAVYRAHYSDQDRDFSLDDESASRAYKLSKEKRKAIELYMTSCAFGDDLCMARAARSDKKASPIYVLGQIGMKIEPTKEQLENAEQLEKYIELSDKILNCKTRRELNLTLKSAFESGVAKGFGRYNTDSEIVVCSTCRAALNMTERQFADYYRKHFLVQSVILGENDTEDKINDAEIKNARDRMLNVVSACPQPLEKGMFSAKTDWWCVETGSFFYKNAPQGRQIALVRVSPQERAIEPNARKDIVGRPLGKPVYYRIPVSDEGGDQIFSPGSLARKNFADRVKKLKRRLKRMRSSVVSGVTFSGSSSSDPEQDEGDDGGYIDASDDDEYDSN